MSTPIIEIEHLTRLIPKTDQPVVDDVSLSINAADKIGLAGPNGSGKTSLLRSIARLDPVNCGELRFQGAEVTSADIPKFRRQVVYLQQRPTMLAGTTRDNLQLPFTFESSIGSFDENRIATWLHSLSKPRSLLDQMVDTLSGGEQQLVALIRAIQIDPVVLLLDEPTASLDSETTERFERLVNMWHGESPQRAFVWIGHDEEQLQRITTRMLRIDRGKVIQ